MRKKILFILVICIQSLYPQKNDDYLVQLHKESPNILQTLSQLGVSIYHLTETEIFAGVSSNQLQLLQTAKLQFHILDKAQGSSHYYLANSRSSRPQEKISIPGEVLWSDGRSNLVKIEKGLLNQMAFDLYRFTELKQYPLSVKEEHYSCLSVAVASMDSIIRKATTAISPDSISATIQSLQNFRTRFLFAPNRDSVAWWIRDEYIRRGFIDVALDSFPIAGSWASVQYSTWQKNVVATIKGSKDTSVIIVIGGHHDSYSSGNPVLIAPGADDNASGTAAVLELARVIKQTGYIPEVTFKFVTFAAEELGLYGGEDFALKARASGVKIKLMINHDMISNSATSTGMGVFVLPYSGFIQQAEEARDLTNRYTNINASIGYINSSGSDSYEFWIRGYPSVYFEERDFSPSYHTPSDIISNINSEFCAEVIKGSCATLIHADQVPNAPSEFVLTDQGDGSHLLATWNLSPENDVITYNVHVGISSGTYSRLITTDKAYVSIDGLSEAIQYYIGISAVDADGNESAITERSKTPWSVPLAPAQLFVEARWHEIELHWQKNLEGDLKGYTIYRSNIAGEIGQRLNGSLSLDTSFTDSNVQNGVYYYYIVKAIDNTNLESTSSPEARARAVSLDQGICIVDETKDGDGSLINPTDEQVDNFFNSLLSDFNPKNYDVASEGSVALADIGAYSTIIWHGNDLSDITKLTQAQSEIGKYLNFGGKILLTTYLPSRALAGNASTIANFGPGDFIYDQFRISKSENISFSRFYGAAAIASGYQSIMVDTTKTSAASNFHLTSIEAISAGQGATEIFSYITNYAPTSLYGKMKDKPVGVEYLTSTCKVITLSFPLYYMEYDQAKALVNHILIDQFGIPVSVQNHSIEVPREFSISQNYPNPFNPSTVISYQLPVTSHINFKVFDILGRQVATLVNEVKQAGVYKVTWDASSLPSGVYFYQINAGGFVAVKKAVLVK